MGDWRRLKLVGISFAGVVFVAPLFAATVRSGDVTTLLRGLGAVAAGLGLLGGTALRRLGYVGHVGDGTAAVSGGLVAVAAFTGSSVEMVSFGSLCVLYGLANASLTLLPRPSRRIAAAAAAVLGGGVLVAAVGVVSVGATHPLQIPSGVVGVALFVGGVVGVLRPERLSEFERSDGEQ
jgi:hypothetical protein